MRRILNFTFVLLNIVFFAITCKGSKTSSSPQTAALGLLATQTGSVCTISSIGTSINAGFTDATSTAQPVLTNQSNAQYFGVVRVQGALLNTVANFEGATITNPEVYLLSTCPLNLDGATPTVRGTNYNYITTATGFNLIFLRSGTYMIVINSRTPLNNFTVKLSGTVNVPASSSTTGNLSALTSETAATNTTPSSNVSLGSCYVGTAPSFTSCVQVYAVTATTLSCSFLTGTVQSFPGTACSGNNPPILTLVGTCLVSKSNGYRQYFYYSGSNVTQTQLQSSCTGAGFTFNANTQTP